MRWYAVLWEHHSVGMRNDEVLGMVKPSLFSFVVAIGFFVQSWPLALGGAVAAGVAGLCFSRKRRNRQLDDAVARAKAFEEERLAQSGDAGSDPERAP